MKRADSSHPEPSDFQLNKSKKKRTPNHKRNSSHTKMSQIRGLRFIQKRFNSQKSWELEGTKHQRYHWGYAPFSYYVQWNGPTVSFQYKVLKYFIGGQTRVRHELKFGQDRKSSSAHQAVLIRSIFFLVVPLYPKLLSLFNQQH